jgi:hypothetical protein
VHIGERYFGVLGRLHDLQYLDLPGPEALFYPFRALQASLVEAGQWGAALMVVKGDLTRRNKAAEVREVARLLASAPMPVEVVLGNHDNVARVDTRAIMAAEGLCLPWGPRSRDVPGLRLVLMDSVHPDPGYHRGHIPRPATEKIVELVSGAPGGAWVGFHHPPERYPFPTVYPPGVPYGQSRGLLGALEATGKPVLVSCGHRHRNRRYRYGTVEVSEVGSTKDYPGVWASYKVFEGGLIQCVRRVARPDVISWTEITRRAINGQWGRWSPGALRDRCFSLSWA